MAGVNALIKRLERLGSAAVRERIAKDVAGALYDETMRGFREQRDPYGTPWAPRKKRPLWVALAFGEDTGWPLLNYTGRGIGSVRAKATRDMVRLTILGRMKFHQLGTIKMVRRAFWPVEGRGLGLWLNAVNKASVEAVRAMMRGEWE